MFHKKEFTLNILNKKKSLIDIPLVHARSCPGDRNFIFVTLLFECFVEFSVKKKDSKKILSKQHRKKMFN